MKEGKKKGRKDGKKERRKEGRVERRKERKNEISKKERTKDGRKKRRTVGRNLANFGMQWFFSDHFPQYRSNTIQLQLATEATLHGRHKIVRNSGNQNKH
jgi:hypothetical protein